MKKMVLLILSAFFFADFAFAQCDRPVSCTTPEYCSYTPSCLLDSDRKGFTWNYGIKGLSQKRRTKFWVGEEISIPIDIEGCCDCIVDATSTLEDGDKKINLRLETKKWLTESEKALYYPNGYDGLHWRDRQTCYYELVGTASQPGSYSGQINLKQIRQSHFHYIGKAVMEDDDLKEYTNSTINFSIDVNSLDEPMGSGSKPNSKATIISRDAAASYYPQAEIYSYLINNTNTQQTLDNPFIDYYMTLPNDQQTGIFSIWKLPENSCIQVIECDGNNYVFRHQYAGIKTLDAGEHLGEFQLALYDAPNYRTNLDWFNDMSEKTDEYDANEDYSYLYPAESYDHSAARNKHYNYKMASFEKNGTLLYGNYPSWLNSSCHIIQPKERVDGEHSRIQYRATAQNNLKWCNADDFVIPSNQIPSNLTVQFLDLEPDHPTRGYFVFRVKNDDNADVNLDGYQIRFYYDKTSYDPALLKFIQGSSNPTTWSTERCRDDLYMLKINLGSDAVAASHNYYPANEQVSIRYDAFLENGANVEKQNMTSWMGVSNFADNNLVGLFDANGRKVFGYAPQCDNGEHHGGDIVTNSNLKVQFADAQASQDYHGDFMFNVVNTGSKDASIGGYELLFYYDDAQNPANAKKVFDPYNLDGASYSYQQCSNNKYVLKIKLKSDAIVKAGSSYPSDASNPLKVGAHIINYIAPMTKSNMESWINTTVMTDDPQMSLYDANGNWVYGKSGAVCGYSDGGNNNGGNQDNDKHDIKEDEYKFSKLTAQFVDYARDVVFRGDFAFQVNNAGNKEMPIGNYEMLFYYYSHNDFNAADVKFYDGNLANSIITKEVCADGKFALRIKLDENAFIAPYGTYPVYSPITVAMDMGGKTINKRDDIYSWTDASIMSDDPKMALYDDKGNLIFGQPRFNCSNSITVPKGGTSSGSVTANNYKFTVWETESLYDYSYQEQGENGQTENIVVKNGQAEVTLTVKNIGTLNADGPIYVEYFITHPDGQVPLLTANGKELSTAGVEMAINDQLSVVRHSVGDRHVFIFTVKDGLKINNEVSINFKLNDNCITCVDKDEAETFFTWNVMDDWSRAPNFKNNSGSSTVENVVVLTNDLVPRYGASDPYAARYKVAYGEGNGPLVEIPGIEVEKPNPNRTDAAVYSGGQILVNGSFEESSMIGWELKSGNVNNIRGATTQGSRFIKLSGEICQEIPESAIELLADSAAVLSFWHKDESCTEGQKNCNNFYVKLGNASYDVPGSAKWFRQSVFFLKGELSYSQNLLCIETSSEVSFDDMVLVPNSSDQPITYAVRFTTTQHEEIESRSYDGSNKLLVTSSERDAMGRTWYKYLPFEYLCYDAKDCNSEIYTLDYPDMAKERYTKDNPFYADAQGFPFVETKWKPDPAATKDVEGAPGKAFSLDADSKEHHVVRTYSSGVNLEGIDTTDFTSLASAVNAVRNCRVYTENECLDNAKSDDGDYNFHAAKDKDPTHMWEMTIEQNGIAAFTVKDGEGRTIVSGSMKKTSSNENGKVAYELLTRSVYELNAQGKVIKAHSPLSCDYTPKPTKCVDPSYFNYDSQNRLVKVDEPDAGISRIYYDRFGRIRATQTQNQIGTKSATAILYDHLNRAIATGEWKHNKKEEDLETALLTDETFEANKENFPSEEALTPGTITRKFYDKVPTEDTLNFLGVDIAPSNVSFENTRGRVTATISDVRAVFNTDGSAKKATSGADSVIRVSTANSYDKYGRVLASYSFDPTLPDDSLWILAVETEYDLGGKVLTVTKYPYGLSDNAKKRKITESYNYDRLGRVESIFAKDGSSPENAIATYEYLPTGAVKSIKMGNALTLSYSYHISGAVKTIDVTSTREEQLYSETLYYEDCGDGECTPQYNGNISRMLHKLAHSNQDYEALRDVQYTYDELNRLTSVADANQPIFDEMFEYDVQGRITAQRRAKKNDQNNKYEVGSTGGEYTYDNKNNHLISVADGMGGSADTRIMSESDNFEYDSEGHLTKDKSKKMEISYDWKGMPVEFTRNDNCIDIHEQIVCGSTKLALAYDGLGHRISKTRMRDLGNGVWETEQVTHYTGIGTEIRENFAGESPETKVVVNMPQGLGRYEIEDASEPANVNTSRTFEWFLKNHIGSTMLVYASGYGTPGTVMAAYDYRAFGEQIELKPSSSGKITENFTGKERDDEIELNYFGARYLDPMLGMWTSVDPERQFASPYLYAGNGGNPIGYYDNIGNYLIRKRGGTYEIKIVTEADAYSGVLIRDGLMGAFSIAGAIIVAITPEAAAAVAWTTIPASILYGLAKGALTEGAAGATTGAAEAIQSGAMGLMEQVAGNTATVAYTVFDLARGYQELSKNVDSDAFINEFNRRMQDPNVYNSFKTPEEAKAFADDINNSINNSPAPPELTPPPRQGNPHVEVGPVIIEKTK